MRRRADGFGRIWCISRRTGAPSPRLAQTTGQLCQTGPHAVKSRARPGGVRPAGKRLGSTVRAGGRSAAPVPRSRTSWRIAMRRRPSRLVAVTAAVFALTACEARVHGTPPPVDPDAPQLTVVAPQGPLAPLPEAAPDDPASSFDGIDGPHQAGHGRRRRQGCRHHHRRAGPLNGAAGVQRQQQGHRDRVRRKAVHRR